MANSVNKSLIVSPLLILSIAASGGVDRQDTLTVGATIKCLVNADFKFAFGSSWKHVIVIGDEGEVHSLVDDQKALVQFRHMPEPVELFRSEISATSKFKKRLAEIDKRLAKEGFARGDIVKSLALREGDRFPRPVKVGEEGVVVGMSLHLDQLNGVNVGVAFGESPTRYYAFRASELATVDQFVEKLMTHAQKISQMGFPVNTRVQYLLAGLTEWSVPRLGMEGEVLLAVPVLDGVYVRWHDSPMIAMQHPFSQISTVTSFNKLMADRSKRLASFGLEKGDLFKSLISRPNWSPRPLNVGDGGSILGAGILQGLEVSLDGNPRMVGTMELSEICISIEVVATLRKDLSDKEKRIVELEKQVAVVTSVHPTPSVGGTWVLTLTISFLVVLATQLWVKRWWRLCRHKRRQQMLTDAMCDCFVQTWSRIPTDPLTDDPYLNTSSLDCLAPLPGPKNFLEVTFHGMGPPSCCSTADTEPDRTESTPLPFKKLERIGGYATIRLPHMKAAPEGDATVTDLLESAVVQVSDEVIEALRELAPPTSRFICRVRSDVVPVIEAMIAFKAKKYAGGPHFTIRYD